MDEIIPLVNKEIQQKIDNRYFDEAITDVNGYLLLAPESDSLKNLKKKAEEAAKKDKKDNDDANSSVSSAKQAQSQAKYDSSEDARMNILASKLIDTTQVITSSEANVRSGPSLNASVVGTVTRGDSVYVYSVQPAPGRVWCNVGNGEWISSKTMGYN